MMDMFVQPGRYPVAITVVSLHASERWAGLVLAVRNAICDPRTLANWAKLVNMSEPTLRVWCYMAGVSPRNSLTLARVIRAVVLAPALGCSPGELLDVRDPRTLRSLLNKAGIKGTDVRNWPTLLVFLQTQTLVGGQPLQVLITLANQQLSR